MNILSDERIYDYMNINSKNQRIFWLANTKVDIELDKSN